MPSEPDGNCDDATFDMHTYWICNDGQSWDQARATCMAAGGDLIAIGSSQEENFIERELDRSREYWIGLDQKNASGAGEDGTWEWSDGSALTFERWNNGEPDDADCGRLTTPLLLGDPGWEDANCGNDQRFICEMP